ncbi:hypothetical protein EB796_024596 [Bugula neritina]|uniref:Uncharacterized protein n=1 Tax=Bugula neritina TaxID=10212 RepID=A0A7J7IU84_BUGNE|nr:hypothetical protein EB796_024596 [Bugula neritina]
MATLTYEDESELSDHSSLAEEDLDLERDRKRKANKVGYHRPLTYFAKAGEAADPRTKKSERTPKYSIASALKTAGAVALIGAAWTAKKPVHNATITGQAIAAVAAAKVKRKGDPEKSVAAALKKLLL